MFNFVSLVIGALLFIPALIAFVPLFGWMYWGIIPLAMIGLLVGLISGSDGRGGVRLNGLIILIGLFRLFIFGGII